MFRAKDDRWCCVVFRDYYERAGQRGFGVVVKRSGSQSPFFKLQFRAVEGGLEQKVSVPPNVVMSLVTDLGVQFCPWCGEKLTKFYGSRINDLYRPDLAIEVA